MSRHKFPYTSRAEAPRKARKHYGLKIGAVKVLAHMEDRHCAIPIFTDFQDNLAIDHFWVRIQKAKTFRRKGGQDDHFSDD